MIGTTGKFESFRASDMAGVYVESRAIMRLNLWFCYLIHPVNQLSSIFDKKIEKLRATVCYDPSILLPMVTLPCICAVSEEHAFLITLRVTHIVVYKD